MQQSLGHLVPVIDATVFVAEQACVVGEVHLGTHSSVWFHAVLRGDVGPVHIGSRTNVQDGCVLHMPPGGALVIGNDVTIGHRAIVHGATIGNRVLIGMGAIVLDEVVVGDECLIGAGALVTPRTRIPARSLVLGAPARVVRTLRDDEIAGIVASATEYVEGATRYRASHEGQP
jgi:carbonic anhydrase/acetyltransferase-like protein (isoleucine patch superfamily)